MIQKLGRQLRQHRDLYAILTVPTAKVPIVKFCHRIGKLEIDICLYNQLALRNTELLKLYSEIDPRAKVLGYVMKLFAKVCDIGDASRGSLSSYAYILMVIYFLQQQQPPVLPVLQQIGRTKNSEDIVDGWNAWFFKDMSQLPYHWPEVGLNQECVAQLWVDMLRFYTETFNFCEHVICIRKHEPLTRFEKLWNGNTIAIEDPFNLGHNLGAGISVKMNTYIMKALRKGRSLFGTSLQQVPREYTSLQSYLFSSNELVDGERPMDKCCRCCGRIGHKAKECHITLQRKKYQQEARAKNIQKAKVASAEKGSNDARKDRPNAAHAICSAKPRQGTSPAGNVDQVRTPKQQKSPQNHHQQKPPQNKQPQVQSMPQQQMAQSEPHQAQSQPRQQQQQASRPPKQQRQHQEQRPQQQQHRQTQQQQQRIQMTVQAQQQMQQQLILMQQQQQQQQQLFMQRQQQQQQLQAQRNQQQQFQRQHHQTYEMMRHMVRVSGPPSPSDVCRMSGGPPHANAHVRTQNNGPR